MKSISDELRDQLVEHLRLPQRNRLHRSGLAGLLLHVREVDGLAPDRLHDGKKETGWERASAELIANRPDRFV